MKVTSFSIRDNYLVGFCSGSTNRDYMIHFDIEAWHKVWEREGIILNDFLDKKAYCITSIRNARNGKLTKFLLYK